MELAPHVLHSSALTLTWTRKEAEQLRLATKRATSFVETKLWYLLMLLYHVNIFCNVSISCLTHLKHLLIGESHSSPRVPHVTRKVSEFFTFLPFKLLTIRPLCHSYIRFLSLSENNHFWEIHCQICNSWTAVTLWNFYWVITNEVMGAWGIATDDLIITIVLFTF